MVTGVGATIPTDGVSVGATPSQHVPQEAGLPAPQTVMTAPVTKRSGENRRVSVQTTGLVIDTCSSSNDAIIFFIFRTQFLILLYGNWKS